MDSVRVTVLILLQLGQLQLQFSPEYDMERIGMVF